MCASESTKKRRFCFLCGGMLPHMQYLRCKQCCFWEILGVNPLCFFVGKGHTAYHLPPLKFPVFLKFPAFPDKEPTPPPTFEHKKSVDWKTFPINAEFSDDAAAFSVQRVRPAVLRRQRAPVHAASCGNLSAWQRVQHQTMPECSPHREPHSWRRLYRR